MPKEPRAAPDKETARRWTKILEDRGVEVVGRLLVESGPDRASIIGGTGGVPITKGFAEDWVRMQRGAVTRREKGLLRWTVVAAVAGIVAAFAAIVAAWPVIKDWPAAIKDFLH